MHEAVSSLACYINCLQLVISSPIGVVLLQSSLYEGYTARAEPPPEKNINTEVLGAVRRTYPVYDSLSELSAGNLSKISSRLLK